MPAISFSVHKDKLLSGKKNQTIRRPRKRPLNVGDILHVFWKMRTKQCEKLGVTKIVKIERKRLADLSQEDVRKDGFLDKKGLIAWFLKKHGSYSKIGEFDVITFAPLNQGEA